MGAQPDGLLELLTGQDWLSVTGSWETAYALRRHPVVAINAIRFTAEADSLNAVIRGEDVTPDDPEFAIFVKGLLAEMTQKAGQKCTAICRVFVPCKQLNDLEAAVSERLAKIIVWNPSRRVRANGSAGQPAATRGRPRLDRQARGWGRRVFGDPESVPKTLAPGADFDRGAFLSPVLLAEDPDRAEPAHHRGLRTGRHAGCLTKASRRPSAT